MRNGQPTAGGWPFWADIAPVARATVVELGYCYSRTNEKLMAHGVRWLTQTSSTRLFLAPSLVAEATTAAALLMVTSFILLCCWHMHQIPATPVVAMDTSYLVCNHRRRRCSRNLGLSRAAPCGAPSLSRRRLNRKAHDGIMDPAGTASADFQGTLREREGGRSEKRPVV